MTDYNDGKWHGWNGGECPVHPESIVEYVWTQDGQAGLSERRAGKDKSGAQPAWSSNIKAFRVVKQHRDPQEVYFRMDESWGWRECHSKDTGATLFREVLE